MTVVSLDTRETITFSLESLKIHRATAKGYAYGTHLYDELVARYPKQETLILGILYPVDKAKAIAAKNGEILGYPPGLIESNEYSLVSKLQAWIDGYLTRWVNTQYTYTDSLYMATCLGILYINLVPAIITARLAACKTNEAHSFHVTQYLISHGLEASQIELLTLKQSLWLYRNIRYIQRNLGTQENFEWLMEHVMTERGLPLAEYTMRHDVSALPENTYPEVTFRKKTLNLPSATDNIRTYSLNTILGKENGLAKSNAKVRDEVLPSIQAVMENSPSAVVATKFLESSVVDRTNNTPYTLNDILMNHWLYLAANDRYSAYIFVVNPKTGERIPMTVKEAFIFVWYAFCVSNGIAVDGIPRMLATRVQRLDLPTVDDLYSIVDHQYFDRSIAEKALAPQPAVGLLVSTEAFYNHCTEIYKAAQQQRRLIVDQEHHIKRGQVFGMVSRIYGDAVCTMTDTPQTYSAWFAERNIPIDSFSTSELGLLYVNIVQEATGMLLTTTKSLKDLQKAMVKIMATFSSYSVQYNTEITNSDMIITDWTAIRVGDVRVRGKSELPSPNLVVDVRTVGAKGGVDYQFDITPIDKEQSAEVRGKAGVGKFEVPVAIRSGKHGVRIRSVVNVASVRLSAYPPLKPNSRGITPVIGIENYLNLPLEQQVDFIDMYDPRFTSLPPDTTEVILIPLHRVLFNTELGPIVYLGGSAPGIIDLSFSTRTCYLGGFEKS